jgi:hypothetical protein
MATTELFLKMVFDRWNGSIKNWDAILNSLTDETLQKEIAPGKNHATQSLMTLRFFLKFLKAINMTKVSRLFP